MTNTVLREPSELVECMTDEQIKHMVQRFLCWKLPEHFCPDAGISFDPVFNKGTPYEMRHQPIGTNLFGYDEAKAMVRFMLEGLPASPTPEPSPEELSYRWAHEDAVEMGYPSLTEALEHLSELRASRTPEPSLREALEYATISLTESQVILDFDNRERAEQMFEQLHSDSLSASPAEPQEATEARAIELLAALEDIDGNKAGAFALRNTGVIGIVFEQKLAAVLTAMRSAASGGDTV